MRASRLVSLLLLLQSRGSLTAPELAEELEVSVRTVYRDVEALSAAGVPVYAESGRGGGVRLVAGYRTRLTGLSSREAEALLLAGTPGPVGELGLGTVFAAAQAKLLAALPKDVAERAFLVRQRFHLDSAGWFRSSRVPPHLGPVSAAVWEGRRLEIGYYHFDTDHQTRRVLDPLGLVLKAGVWYLVAMREGETRTYRVSRIRSAKVSSELSVRPAGFDLAAYWAASVTNFEVGTSRVEVTIRGTARAIAVLRGRGFESRRVEHDSDGDRVCASATFDDDETALRELMALGGDIEIIDPTELRGRVLETARSIVAPHSADRAGSSLGAG
jgi:predicted DNA-binding transcriptional regulator YafY